MRIIFEEDHVLVHGNAVPESGRISIIEHDSSQRREIVWEPIAAGDWTFLGGSAFDTGFRQDLNDIAEYFKPKRNDSGLRYLVIKLRDGATLPSLHFSPGGIERVESAFQAFFIIKKLDDARLLLLSQIDHDSLTFLGGLTVAFVQFKPESQNFHHSL